MLKNSKDFIGVTLTEDYLKIAHVKGKGAVPKVTNVALHDIKGLPAQGLVGAIKKALKGVNSKKSNVIFVIPPSMVSTKNIEIPSVNEEEIKSIVGLQAGRHTPFSREEIQVGYVNIGVYKSNFTKVLLVIANKSSLKEKMGCFEKAGIKITDVMFAPEGMAQIYAKANVDNTTVGIIDVDATTTEFLVIKNGVTVSSRNIPLGRKQLATEGLSAQAKLIEEFKRTVESYQSEDIDQIPSAYYITYEDEHTQSLQVALSLELNWTVTISSYIDNIKISGGNLKKISTVFDSVSFLDVIATAGGAVNAQVSLMPEEVVFQKNIADQGKEVLKTAVLTFIILVLIAAIFGVKLYFKGEYLAKIKKEYRNNKKEVVMLEEKSNRTKILRNFFETRMVALDTINELYDSIPEEIYLTSVKLEENGDVSIQGISDVASIVFNLGTALKESEIFKSVNIKSTTSRKDRGKDVSAFEITLKINSAIDEDIEAQEE
ncbi:MAG: Tfp pilus assembly PilM family ATPase/Tfp pilus assembly protein PilN [Lysobacterales bacterium]|jgi:Tfp pilus assembly PilM family ATPase/Tfp pilus assembly protein PilN